MNGASAESHARCQPSLAEGPKVLTSTPARLDAGSYQHSDLEGGAKWPMQR